jgi:enterochelin esterase-like enzyme
MSPVSVAFRVTTIAVAVLAVVATVVLWNKLRGPRAVRLAARFGMVVTGQALATVAILAYVNVAYGSFFVSWSDLFGSEDMFGAHFAGQQGAIKLHPMAPVTNASTAAIDTSTSMSTTTQRFTGSVNGFQETTLTGRRSGITAQVYVWTPPQYYQDPGKDFPVLELFHGIPGSPSGWMQLMNVVPHLESAMAAGTAHPFILVAPDITPSASHSAPWNNEECSDIPGDARLATWLAGDVRDMVVQNFRAISSGLGWGLMGYSTGGFCAAKLLLQYPKLYQAAVSLSGYYTPESQLLTSDPALDQKNSPLWLIGHDRTPAVSLLMTGSEQDLQDPSWEDTQMVSTAKANVRARATEVQSYIAPFGGGHNQRAWEQMLPVAFDWLSDRLSGPRPDTLPEAPAARTATLAGPVAVHIAARGMAVQR